MVSISLLGSRRMGFLKEFANDVRHIERSSTLYRRMFRQRLQMVFYQYAHRLKQP